MERYIAIDNVCAWPNLTLMPDGSIIATIFNQPTHGGWEGDVECWASEDGGKLWHKRGTAAPHEPTTNRMNVAAGLAQDGTLVVLASGWTNRPPTTEEPKVYFADSEHLHAWVCRSTDGGRTWDRSGSVTYADTLHRLPSAFGDIIPLADGTLGVSLYGRDADNPENSSSHFYHSADGGQTWQHRAVIAPTIYNETALVALRSGRLLAVARTWGDQRMDIFASDDSGYTWVHNGPVSLGMQIPAQMIQLADERVLMVYGLRNPGLFGVAARVSSDDGQTWSAPQLLVNLGTERVDCGYPASVQLADESIVTAYYAAGIPQHQRYHMGVIRWEV